MWLETYMLDTVIAAEHTFLQATVILNAHGVILSGVLSV